MNATRTGVAAYNNTMTYDAVGNRLTKVNSFGTTAYTYDAANQLETGEEASGVTTYTYDNAGNLNVTEAPNGDLTTYTWDDENRRTRVLLPSGQLVTALYNGDGLRVEKQDPDGTTKFIWDEQRYLIETDDNDTTQGVYTIEPTSYGNLISQKFGDKLFYHFDGLDSTRALTNTSETNTESFLYDAYGNRLSTNTTIPPFLYVGEQGYYYDPFVLDYYIRARTYSPVIARWLSVDPLVLSKYGSVDPIQIPAIRFVDNFVTLPQNIESSEGVSRYQFDYCNPNTFADPNGLTPIPYTAIPFDYVIDPPAMTNLICESIPADAGVPNTRIMTLVRAATIPRFRGVISRACIVPPALQCLCPDRKRRFFGRQQCARLTLTTWPVGYRAKLRCIFSPDGKPRWHIVKMIGEPKLGYSWDRRILTCSRCLPICPEDPENIMIA